MKAGKAQRLLSILTGLVALILIVSGIYGFSLRESPEAKEALEGMRAYTVLATAGQAIIEEEAINAKKAAREFAKTNKYSRAKTQQYLVQVETDARAAATERLKAIFARTSEGLENAVIALDQGLIRYYEALSAEQAQYLKQKAAKKDDPTAENAENAMPSDMAQDDAVDLAGFVQSAELEAKHAALSPLTDELIAQILVIAPEYSPEFVQNNRALIENSVRTQKDNFVSVYHRAVQCGSEQTLSSSLALGMTLANRASDAILLGLGLLIFALTFFFYRPIVDKIGMPRLVISLFFIVLCVVAGLNQINIPSMISNILKRTGMYGILALAMLPGIQSGISLNLGIPIGIIAGLLSTMTALEMNLAGWPAFLFAIAGGTLIAIPSGWLYGKLLNRLKGNEMTVSFYVGSSYVSLMSIAWMILPFNNPKLTWALGRGLRVMHNMKDSFGGLLDNILKFELFGVTVPTGLLLFFLMMCLIMYLYERTKSGIAMIAGGSNPAFARASGIDEDKTRVRGTILSSVLAAIGIIVYAQSFGFMQLYGGPQQMGFVAASAILIGGASVSKGKVSNVIIGTLLFQGIIALGIQVANAVIAEGGLAEVSRILISNGIILYALTQAGGGKSRA